MGPEALGLTLASSWTNYFNLSKVQFPHLQNKDKNTIFSIWSL